MTDWQNYGFDTRAVRAGQVRSAEGEHSELIVPTSSYVFKNAAQAEARFKHTEEGNIYSRFTNPTVRTFEERLATMEGGEVCIGTSSGMAAIMAVCLGLLKTGDHIVASQSIFGTTVKLFDDIFARFGIEMTFVKLTDFSAWQSAIRKNTRFLFLETPSNPLLEIVDIKALADLAHVHNTLLIVDNCLCTPVLQKPLSLGADLVIHSATKFLDGQGRCIGGAIVGAKNLLDSNSAIYGVMRSGGPSMSPFNAWIFLKGLETLSIRMKAHCDNAMKLAQWLEKQSIVTKVYYPGLPSHPQHELAKIQQSGFGGLVSFEVKGGKESAWRVLDATEFLSITANLGDTKTTITHPATTTHSRLSEEQRRAANISDGLIRISVGLEDVEDIQNDLARGM
jgi:O-succinylhomoserine sulfhydrylase